DGGTSVNEIEDGDTVRRHLQMSQQQRQSAAADIAAADHQNLAGKRLLHGRWPLPLVEHSLHECALRKPHSWSECSTLGSCSGNSDDEDLRGWDAVEGHGTGTAVSADVGDVHHVANVQLGQFDALGDGVERIAGGTGNDAEILRRPLERLQLV